MLLARLSFLQRNGLLFPECRLPSIWRVLLWLLHNLVCIVTAAFAGLKWLLSEAIWYLSFCFLFWSRGLEPAECFLYPAGPLQQVFQLLQRAATVQPGLSLNAIELATVTDPSDHTISATSACLPYVALNAAIRCLPKGTVFGLTSTRLVASAYSSLPCRLPTSITRLCDEEQLRKRFKFLQIPARLARQRQEFIATTNCMLLQEDSFDYPCRNASKLCLLATTSLPSYCIQYLTPKQTKLDCLTAA